MYMDFGTAMERSVVTVSAVGNAGSNTQIMMRVVSLEGKLLDVPEYQGVPIQEWTTYLFHRRVKHSSDPTVACASRVNLVGSCPPRRYLGLQVRRFCGHPPWCLRGFLCKAV